MINMKMFLFFFFFFCYAVYVQCSVDRHIENSLEMSDKFCVQWLDLEINATQILTLDKGLCRFLSLVCTGFVAEKPILIEVR